MRTFVTTSIAAALLGSTAFAAEPVAVIVPEKAVEMEMKREVVDFVQDKYGETAVYEDADALPDRLNRKIIPGAILPEEAMAAVPAGLDGMPTLREGSRWVRAGNHLVEIAPDGRIVMAVYDVLG